MKRCDNCGTTKAKKWITVLGLSLYCDVCWFSRKIPNKFHYDPKLLKVRGKRPTKVVVDDIEAKEN